MKPVLDEREKLAPVTQHLLWSVGGISVIGFALFDKVASVNQSLAMVAIGLGCAFASYGITCFIRDLRESTDVHELFGSIKNNIKRAFR